MFPNLTETNRISSLPSWECGLKCPPALYNSSIITVAPFVGVWIEMPKYKKLLSLDRVAPFVGVWIEIFFSGKPR